MAKVLNGKKQAVTLGFAILHGGAWIGDEFIKDPRKLAEHYEGGSILYSQEPVTLSLDAKEAGDLAGLIGCCVTGPTCAGTTRHALSGIYYALLGAGVQADAEFLHRIEGGPFLYFKE